MMRSSTTSNYRSSSGTNINSNTTGALSPASPTLKNQQPSSPTSPLVDPRQLDANLLELSLISQRASLFQGFLHERANEEMEKLEDEKENNTTSDDGKDRRFYGKNGLLASSGLAKRIKEVMNSFLVIDEYLLKQSMDKVSREQNAGKVTVPHTHPILNPFLGDEIGCLRCFQPNVLLCG